MMAKVTIAIILLTTTIKAQKEYCKTIIPKILVHNVESRGGIPKSAMSRLQRICEKAITCTDEGCRGPFVRNKDQCAACSSIIITFMNGELESANEGLRDIGRVAAFIQKNGLKIMLPQPENCQKLGNGFCKWQDKLQECAEMNENGKVPRSDCEMKDPCSEGHGDRCDSELRTINGEVIDVPSERPWLAFLRGEKGKGKFICGGAWISNNAIVTAAHCVTSFDVGYAGLAKNDWGNSQSVKYSPADVHMYPDKDVDLAVIVFKDIVSNMGEAKPIDIPPVGARVRKGEMVRVAGWGVKCENPPTCTEQGGPGGANPEEVVIPVVCQSGFDSPCHFIKERSSTFQAGGIDESGHARGVCKGDSGSPVICGLDRSSKAPYVCGVVSSGDLPPKCGFSPANYIDLTIPEIRQFLQHFQTISVVSTTLRAISRQSTWVILLILILRMTIGGIMADRP